MTLLYLLVTKCWMSFNVFDERTLNGELEFMFDDGMKEDVK